MKRQLVLIFVSGGLFGWIATAERAGSPLTDAIQQEALAGASLHFKQSFNRLLSAQVLRGGHARQMNMEKKRGVRELLAQMQRHDPEFSALHMARLRRVVRLMINLLRESGDPITIQEEIVILDAADLHDIGKLKVPHAILNYPGPLSSAQWQVMRAHPREGEYMAYRYGLLKEGLIIGDHQEKFDGSGYPWGIEGDAIELGARIIAIADAIDAMAHDRPYRKARTKRQIIMELQNGHGKQFDPHILNVLLANDLDRLGLWEESHDIGAPLHPHERGESAAA
jgi:HD-GYP domain-containing protein (c-di-GMP phosphodiesterase class II)